MLSQSTNVTDRQTDGQTDDMRSQDRTLQCTKVHRTVKRSYRIRMSFALLYTATLRYRIPTIDIYLRRYTGSC